MQSPLWILNAILSVLVLIIFLYIGLSFRKITDEVYITPLRPLGQIQIKKIEKPKAKDIKYIYEGNDLFGTYIPEALDLPPVLTLPKVPNPPTPKPLISQSPSELQFLEPLPIKISGIIAHSIESKSQVTIVNTKTKESSSYKIGDKLFDAYIIRIFPKKIILIRSNGQQETLFINQSDAEKEIKALKETSWKDVVAKISDNSFSIKQDSFVKRIKSLAQLIEMLDVSTAFKNGISVGCRIGKMERSSIGYSLGLIPGDIITKISGIAPTTTTNRVKIYNKISSLRDNEKIEAEIFRNNNKITKEYFIKKSKKTNNPQIKIQEKIKTNGTKKIENTNNSKKEIAQKKQTLRKIFRDQAIMANESNKTRPQLRRFKKRDRLAMSQYGSRNSVLDNLE